MKIKSEWLWSNSPDKSWEEFKVWVEATIGKIKDNKISRLDPCCHTDEFTLALDDMNRFKGNFRRANIEFTNREVNAFTFGSRDSKVYCRIYNKTLEVNVKKKKTWFFDIWNNDNLCTNDVWNIEFELKREFFKEYSIDSVEDAFSNLKSIWNHCSCNWLIQVVLDKSRIERCSIDEIWVNIQNIFSNYKGQELIKRETQLARDATALVPGTIGNITSYAAKKGIKDINMILTLLRNEGFTYLNNARKTDYNDVITEKMATT